MYVLENLNSSRVFSGVKYPEKVEAFIKDVSKELLNTASSFTRFL
jgi:hypothetical protein